jgi:hypothetical protein
LGEQVSPLPATLRRIPKDAVFALDELRQVLGLKKGCLPREARLGRLRVSRRAGKSWTTGAWVRAWLEAGEVHRREKPAKANGTSGGTSTTT